MSTSIVRVLTRLGAGGPPIHAVLVTREMNHLGYTSVLVAGRCDSEDGDMSYLLRPDDPVHWIEEMSRRVSPWQDFKALVKLYRFLRRERPAIVHTHTAKAGVLGRIAARLAGVPVVVHTFHGNVLNGYFSRPVNAAIRLLERTLARFTDAICVIAPQQAEEMSGRYRIAPREKVHVVPLGMDLEAFRKLPPPPNGECLTVGWLGRMVPIKDIPLLLSIIRETVRRTDRVNFVIAGDGPERSAVEELSRELGADRCEMLGWQRDVGQVIARCHLLIQTSKNEGTPVALIQGMAAGRPFLSTPVGGVVDMAPGAGVRDQKGCRWHASAVLADANPAAFAGALCEMAARPELVAQMGREAAQFAARSYTLPALTSSLDHLYSKLLGVRAVKRSLEQLTEISR
ncbi:MAG: glycosyltransferase [Bryobacteraceae bacterium]